ncbi:hypothetical protein FOA52_008451 [Chlamydomonas sp. UWO 241]|nr:hypothetical protein FOA52_008451 [Chlamydomonas sp. UWO 241]
MRLGSTSLCVATCAFLGLCAWAGITWRATQAASPMCEMTYNYNDYFVQSSPLLPADVGYRLLLFRDRGPSVVYGHWGPPNVPVLFIPGNAGQYTQARGLASESQRQWQKAETGATDGRPSDGRTPAPTLDWFVVDTMQQLSAFDGAVLVRGACESYNSPNV